MDDQERYQKLQAEKERDWEAYCQFCGMCCSIKDEDPCEHLSEKEKGIYICNIYDNRFGLHKTKAGRVFRCVPLREILNKNWPGDDRCAYKKLYFKSSAVGN